MKSVLRRLCEVFGLGSRLEGRIQDLKKFGMTIGQGCVISLDAEFEEAWATHIRIGNDVTVARGARFISHDASTWRALGATRVGIIEIGDRTFIGAYAVVMPNVRIGSDVVVGSGSVVTRDVPDGTVVAGNPARALCTTAQLYEKTRSKLTSAPSFGEEYRLRCGGTVAMRKAMRERMPGGECYIVSTPPKSAQNSVQEQNVKSAAKQ
jgi:maltose O-acetyltransferase